MTAELDISGSPRLPQIYAISVDMIDANPKQPRQMFNTDSLQEMANSIKREGVLQPVILTQKNERYTVVAGERRVRASRLAGLTSVPALVRELTATDALHIALIENVQRQDLNALEEALAYQTLIEDYGYTQEQCAQKVGKERSSVSNIIRLLALPAEIKQDLMFGRLTMGHCRALLSLPTEELMLEARKIVLKKELSVRQTEALCRRYAPTETKKPRLVDSTLDHLASGLRDHLRTKVRVSGSENRGRIEISYFSAKELERIINLIGGG